MDSKDAIIAAKDRRIYHMAHQIDELKAKLEASEAMKRELVELILRASPLTWCFHEPEGEYTKTASQWENDAEALLAKADKEGL